MHMDIKHKPNPAKNRIALVLQGGGALGAYQAGVFQALHEHHFAPDWVVGTSIGAINAAIIAGNPPETRVQKLREFWHLVSHQDSMDMRQVPDQVRQFNSWLGSFDTMARGVPGFFSPRLFNPFAAGLAVEPDKASFYETKGLHATLEGLVDFEYLNRADGMRLTVNAVKVTCGSLVSFDTIRDTVGPEHIRASGALPPGFPPVRIDGDLYWDGGLYSNTPLETVLEDETHLDTLCFMVDLWSADGPEPTTLDQVQTRQKDVMFASRSSRHIDAYVRTRQLQRTARELYEKLPPELQSKAGKDVLAGLGCDATIHIVRLPYAGRDWNMASKDINFSRGSIEWRWEQGYNDAIRAIGQTDWHSLVSDSRGVVVYDMVPAL